MEWGAAAQADGVQGGLCLGWSWQTIVNRLTLPPLRIWGKAERRTRLAWGRHGRGGSLCWELLSKGSKRAWLPEPHCLLLGLGVGLGLHWGL